MLESITINHFTIIDHSQIEFSAGMTTLTGETGAGKSILLDAIQLVLGDRADSDCVQSGHDKAEISVSFDISNLPDAGEWLQQHELDDDGECLLRRIVQASGRSKAFINGSPVTLSQLKSLGEMLVDLHGQHEHQSLQKPAVQRQLLDASLPDDKRLAACRESYQTWKTYQKQLQQAQDQSQQKAQRIDLLQLYCREFDDLALAEGEVAELQQEYSRLSHAGQIIDISTAVVAQLYENDDGNIQQQLSDCSAQLEQLRQIDPQVQGIAELVSSALIQVQEASSELRNYQQHIDIDPQRLDWLNDRLSRVQGLARKHQVDEEDLVELATRLKSELDSLLFDEADIESLQQQLAQAEQAYLEQAKKLSQQRQQAAEQLSAQISEVMQTLGMQGGQFAIRVEPDPQPSAYSAHGIDQIRFLVSANPGQELKPLHKVASGGELSRISLAIQVILSESSQIPTLIFDEVDSGIGGGIAEIVGKKLRQIAHNRQVFCVTHLPQVAAQAHHHLQVSKSKSASHTRTEVAALDDEQRVEEIARMLGGMTITEQTRAHALEMVQGR